VETNTPESELTSPLSPAIEGPYPTRERAESPPFQRAGKESIPQPLICSYPAPNAAQTRHLCRAQPSGSVPVLSAQHHHGDGLT
jgi:hypothetical protein